MAVTTTTTTVHPGVHHDPQAEPIGLDGARALIRAEALLDKPVGTVGLEIEGHAVVWADPFARPPVELLEQVGRDLGPLPAGGLLSLEPGGQVEVSSAPHPDLPTASRALAQDMERVRAALAEVGLGWTMLGADPLRAPERISRARRYAAMEAFFAADATTRVHGPVMMCSTSALQVNLEPGRPDQWTARVRRAQRLGPLLTALSGTSAFLNAADTGWHSSRQRAWSGLGPLTSGPVGDADPGEGWADRALEAPVVMLPTDDGEVGRPDRRRSLAEWVSDPQDWPAPTVADVRRHLTTIFPPVRLRGWLELRCLDSLPDPWWPAVAAVCVAWMDHEPLHALVDEQVREVGDRWEQAARHGLADPPLQAAAVACLEAAEPVVAAAVRPVVGELVELARAGRSPGSLIATDLRRRGAATVFEELSHG